MTQPLDFYPPRCEKHNIEHERIYVGHGKDAWLCPRCEEERREQLRALDIPKKKARFDAVKYTPQVLCNERDKVWSIDKIGPIGTRVRPFPRTTQSRQHCLTRYE